MATRHGTLWTVRVVVHSPACANGAAAAGEQAADVSLADDLYPVEVAAAARRLHETATVLRHRAARLAAAAEHCHWDGAGAWAFRNSSAGTVARLRHAATGLDEAAEALSRHGLRVAAALAARDEERARAAQRLVHDVRHLPDTVRDDVGHVLHDVGVGP